MWCIPVRWLKAISFRSNPANNLPIEVDEVVLVSIQLATGLGFVVVEAAGNGNLDLTTTPV